MSDWQASILVTGGAGFIGSHVVRRLVEQYPLTRIVNLDALTYAGNLENLRGVTEAPNYLFERGDIRNAELLDTLFATHDFSGVIHLAAESHVDRSITDPMAFIQTNIVGTVNLLNAARQHWQKTGYQDKKFVHISTDEVYGSLGATGYFTEQTAYDPRSPYSASKAASDHLVLAYYHTYGLPVVVSNCSNNYGPYQFPEKLIPLMINNIRTGKPLPIYGDGSNVRDWLWVGDHARAIDLLYRRGKPGETYNIGGNNERSNLELVHELCDLMDDLLNRPTGTSRQLITYVKDRPGHDHRYAIDASKIKKELDWETSVGVTEGLRKTARWYLDHTDWMDHVTSGAYRAYYADHYGV